MSIKSIVSMACQTAHYVLYNSGKILVKVKRSVLHQN